jgi:hypothetical protein
LDVAVIEVEPVDRVTSNSARQTRQRQDLKAGTLTMI